MSCIHVAETVAVVTTLWPQTAISLQISFAPDTMCHWFAWRLSFCGCVCGTPSYLRLSSLDAVWKPAGPGDNLSLLCVVFLFVLLAIRCWSAVPSPPLDFLCSVDTVEGALSWLWNQPLTQSDSPTWLQTQEITFIYWQPFGLFSMGVVERELPADFGANHSLSVNHFWLQTAWGEQLRDWLSRADIFEIEL